MFYALDEYPCLGSKGLSLHPDEWDDQQDMSPTRVRFTPATGALSGVDTWFEYYRGLNDLISAGGKAQIGVRTAAVATFNGYNFNPQRAANPVIAYDAVASLPVLGGLYNDFRAVVYNNKIRLFIAIYGNPSGSNRTAIFESTDGFTFTYVGEAQKDATYLGRTIGALANVSGTLVSLVSIADGAGGGNGRQKWISTDGGLNWLDRGLAIHVGDAGDWNGLNYVGGTMQLEGDYYIALLPGMPFIGNDGGGDPYLDWPEAVGAFRIPAADILTADVLWEANASNPLIIAGPTHNALWHMALFEDRGTTYSTVETWGVPGFENIGTATAEALRTTPYYGTESRVSSSQLYELRMASRHWLDQWAVPVVADGTYTLRHVQSGKFVTVAGGEPVLTETGTIAEFAVARELSFYTISNSDLCLSAIDDLMQTGFEFVTNPGAVDNVNGQWWITPWEDRPADQPQLVVLTNRYSRLALSMPRDTETEGAPLVQAPFLGHASMVFELALVVAAETTTEFPDPENPLLNMDIAQFVTLTGSQILSNKALALPTRAAFVALNDAGRFADMQDGWVVEADGLGYRRVAASTVISDMPGWVPHGGLCLLHFASETTLAADAQPTINTMLAYAATLVEDDGLVLDRNGFAGKVKASLAYRKWLVSDRVDMSQCAGVELCDGTLEADTATWPSPSTYVLRFGGTNDNNNRYMGLRNVVVLCNRVANGILAENLQNSFADDVFIHGQTQYGWRKIGPKAGGCRMRNIRANEWFTTETGYDEKANRTSIGISNECADETYENCEGVLCLINISLSGTGAHVFRQSHPFHGVMADLSTYTITGAVSDGATGTTCTVAATTGLSNGDLVVMPWINGISGEGGTGGRPGSYVISNVTGTTFDVAAYVFAGSFTGDDTPNVTLWSEERVNLLINSDVSVADIDIEADNGKIKIVQDAAGSPRVKLRVLAAGLSANNARCAVELVADGVEADFAGVQVDIHTESSGYRLTAINGGTFADPIAAMVNEFRTDRASRSTALMSVGHGTEAKPSLRFSGLDGGGAISTDANTGFFAHSDHTPALTVDGEEKLHFHASMLLPENGYVIANTATIAQLITAAAAGDFDDLADNSVVWAGGYPFVKQDGAAYDRLPVGFIPRIPSPFAFRAVCDGVVGVVGGEAVLTSGTDDTAAWQSLWAYCNATKIAPNLNGTKIVCIQHNADIIVNTDFDLKGAEIRLIGGMYADGTFSHATIKTAFRAYDADCPIVTGTTTVSDLNMVEGSVTPTADFFTEPGYVEIFADATNGPFVTNRPRTALERFRQPFAVNKDGVVTKPLARSMEGTGSVTYSYRKMPVGGRITIGNFVVDAELFNNQTIFRLSRNNVNVINATVRGEDLPALSQNQMFSVDYAAYITYHDVVAKAMGDPDESKSSYIFHSSHAAEITYSNCIALGEPWGASGQNHVSGIRWLNCTMNRLDVHQAGFNIEILGGYVIGIGVGYGYGGGLLQLNGVTLVNCKVYHRSDWAGDWWGTIRLDNCTLINKSYEAIGFDAGDYSPLGSSLMATQVPNVVITNLTRGDRERSASQISPYKIGLRAGSMPLIAPRQLTADGISAASEYRLSGGACMDDMILPAGISRRTEVSFANIQGCTGYTLDSDWTFKVPATSAVGPAIGATGTITFSDQPAVNSTVTINGTVFTFVTSGATGNQCNIGADLTATMASLAAVLNASGVAGVAAATYSSNTTQLTVGYDMLGVAGNAFTLAASVSPASNGAVSAATLAGGAGHQYNLRISNSNEVAVDVTNSPGVRAYYSDIRLVANYMAINCVTQMSDITFGTPLLKSGFTAAPVCGALTSGTFNFGSVIGGRVEAGTSAWDFSNPRFISGVVISASNASCVYPFGASHEDMFRGWSPELVGKNIMIRQSADRTLSAVTTSQPIFNEGGFTKVSLVAGVYKFKLVYRVENMDAGAASNLRFDLKGAGSATLAHILYDSAGRDATNLMTSASNLTGIMVAVESSLQLLNGAAAANAGGTLDGYFEVTADGTIQPSFLLAVGVAATVKESTTFECTKIASASVAGPWSA